MKIQHIHNYTYTYRIQLKNKIATKTTGCSLIIMTKIYVSNTQARQTRPNSGGVAEGHPRFDKGGVAIIFYFLRVKNRTFRVFTLSD